jgi:hypothetical protein
MDAYDRFWQLSALYSENLGRNIGEGATLTRN